MDVELARWLVSPEAAPALAEAAAQADLDSLASATHLRRLWSAEQAAAALTQASLRRRATAKFGDRAGQLFFTADGLEQATRRTVAAWRAGKFVVAGASRVVDLGCGIGADALAFVDAGLEVVAVELDPATAVLAQANLGDEGRVVAGDALELADTLIGPGDAVFLDPARRTTRGRSWHLSDLSPPWDFATGLLRDQLACVKAGPGLSRAAIPPTVAVAAVEDHRDLVELALWSRLLEWEPGTRVVVLLPDGVECTIELLPEPEVGGVGSYLYEPGPAVIRMNGTPQVADLVGGWNLDPGVAYLASDTLVSTPLATAFAVERVLPYDQRAVRAWLREARVGVLEIKVRGIDVDPAVLRRRLKPAGPNSATIVLTPTREGARVLVVRRVS